MRHAGITAIMLRALTQTDYRVTKNLFMEVFDESEEPDFIRAVSKQRGSLGYFYKGVLVGAAIVTHQQLEYIFIHPDFQTFGYGSKLLKEVMKRCPTLFLTAVADPGVRAWYIKHGFQQVGRNTFRITTYHLRMLARVCM